MKKLFSILLILTAGYGVQAQNLNVKVKINQVPEEVRKAYLSQNSNGINDTIWEKEFITIYKVKYKDEGLIYEAQYTNTGQWIKTFTRIGIDQLPLLVVNQLKAIYPDFSISDASIELSEKGKVYAVVLRRGKSEITEYFTMEGKLYR